MSKDRLIAAKGVRAFLEGHKEADHQQAHKLFDNIDFLLENGGSLNAGNLPNIVSKAEKIRSAPSYLTDWVDNAKAAIEVGCPQVELDALTQQAGESLQAARDEASSKMFPGFGR